ncbi:MAG: hypothetical protein ABI072_04090 [Edaphobacter sp.]
MKNNHFSQAVRASEPLDESTVDRYQVYRESRGGNFVPGFSTDSDIEAIEAFVLQSTAYEGGDIHVLDQNEQRMIAFVKWKVARTEIGLPVLRRVNLFHDWHFALIACDLLMQKKSRDAVEMRF